MDEKYIDELLKLANKAYEEDEVPVSALVVKDNVIISKAYNKRIKNKTPLDHAEIIAIKKAAKKLGDWRLDGCDLYITLEPCDMCKEVILTSRIKNVYYLCNINENKNKYSKTNIIKINNVLKEKEYQSKISTFFSEKRKQNK